LIEAGMKVGERGVSTLLDRAAEKDASFSILLLAEGPDVQQHLPRFFFGQDKGNERRHISSRTPVFEDPQ